MRGRAINKIYVDFREREKELSYRAADGEVLRRDFLWPIRKFQQVKFAFVYIA